MQTKIFLYTAIISAIISTSACNNNNKKAKNHNMEGMNHPEMMKAMHSSMAGMEDIKKTGNFDCDFASMMIIHHQGAIDMSEVEIGKGTNKEIRLMAQNIINTQMAEIDEMHVLLNDLKVKSETEKKSNQKSQFSDDMKNMMEEMKGISTTDNTDKDYVTMMIPHHEAAIEMAKDQIENGKNESLKLMAQKMITDQNKEIDLFKSWLSKQK